MRSKLPILVVLLSSFLAHAQQVPSVQQQHILDLINQARSEQGVPPLAWDAALAASAQTHTQKMIDQRSLSHQLSGEADLAARTGKAGAHFRSIAENIAMAGSVDGLQKEWMKSDQHRANILNPGLNHVGIGLVQQSGYWYSTVVFDNSVASLGPEQIEQQVKGLLQQRNISDFRPPDAARKDCTGEEGDASGTSPGFLMRWEGPNLDHLPDPLEQRLQSGKYKAASVGACTNDSAGNQGFTTYRIAVLLY